MCASIQRGSDLYWSGQCDGVTADEADNVLDMTCDEIVNRASAAGKADVPCPWYFPWCSSLIPEGSGYSVHLLEADSDHLVMQLDIDRVSREPVTIDGQVYEQLSITGATSTTQVGRPAVPTVGMIIGVPWDTIAVDVDTPVPTQSEVWDGVRPAPYRPLQLDMHEPDPWTVDQSSYQDYTAYPTYRATFDEPGVWRDYRVARLQVNPIQAITALDQVVVDTSMVITVHFIRSSSGDETPIVPGTGTDADDAYESSIVNFDTAPPRDTTDALPLDYLVIAADDLLPALQPWLDFKESAGLDVKVIRTSQIPLDEGAETLTPEAIKRVIQDVYDHRHLQYLLLVGAPEFIPLKQYPSTSWWSAGTPSDSFYSFLDGDDMFADVAMGRMHAHTPEELKIVVDKTLAYIRGDRRADWRKRFVAVAHKEQAPEKYTACVKSIVDRDYGRQVEWTTLLGSEGASNEQLTAAINDGAGIVSYRGHGDKGEWCEWGEGGPYKFDDQEISNGEMTPVVFSIACLTAHIETEKSLAEKFMLREGGGAVAFLGAGEPSYTKPNHDFNRYLFHAILDRNVHRIGYLLMQSNAALLRQYGGDQYATDNIKMYFWLGDPSLEVGVPYHCDGSGANAGPDAEIMEGESVVIGTEAQPGKTYAWSPEAGLSCTDCAQPTAAPVQTTTYTLAASNDCSRVEDTVTVTVTPLPEPDAGPEPPDAGPAPTPDAGPAPTPDAGPAPTPDAGPQ